MELFILQPYLEVMTLAEFYSVADNSSHSGDEVFNAVLISVWLFHSASTILFKYINKEIIWV